MLQLPQRLVSAVFGLVAQFKDQLPNNLRDFILRTIQGEADESLEIGRYGTSRASVFVG